MPNPIWEQPRLEYREEFLVFLGGNEMQNLYGIVEATFNELYRLKLIYPEMFFCKIPCHSSLDELQEDCSYYL